MHTITTEDHIIKIVFDKEIYGWHYDKSDIKYEVDSYKDNITTITVPKTIHNFKTIMNKYIHNDNYFFTELFINSYKEETKEEKLLETKRTLLKEKLNLDTIKDRPYLLDYNYLPEDIRYPFNHQKLELEYAVRFPSFYSLDEMGLGKTRVAIERHRFLKEKLNKIDFSFIICPTSLLYNWQNEIKKWCQKDISSLVIQGTRKEKLESINMFMKKVDFFIINFEGIASIKEELLNLINSRTNIVIDEFIKIKNHNAQRSKNLVSICNKTKYVMGLCGTPVSQGSIDLFSPNLCIDKGKKYGISYNRFVDKYFVRYGFSLKPKRATYEELTEKLFKNALRFTKKECLDIPEKLYNTINLDLSKENQEIYNQMLSFCLTELDGVEVQAPIILVQLLRLSQITSGFLKTPDNMILDFKRQPKLDAVEDILNTNNGTQIIIWSRFVRDVKILADLCMKKNISFGCLIGSEKDFNYKTRNSASTKYDYNNPDKGSPLYELINLINPEKPITLETIKKAYRQSIFKYHPDRNKDATKEDLDLLKKINSIYNTLNKFNDMKLNDLNTFEFNKENKSIPSNLIGKDSYSRQQLVDKFQRGDIQIIIGTASTGGLGINLTAAERVIYYSNDYTLINRLQSEDRAHRAGQKKNVSYYDIVCNGTIDIGILEILRSKKNVADIITLDKFKNLANGF